MDSKTKINDLLQKPLCMMTGAEFFVLHTYACTTISPGGESTRAITQVKGVHAIADYCSCSESQIHHLLREGVLESAIVSRIGKSIVFDADEARRRANEYQMQQRAQKKGK